MENPAITLRVPEFSYHFVIRFAIPKIARRVKQALFLSNTRLRQRGFATVRTIGSLRLIGIERPDDTDLSRQYG